MKKIFSLVCTALLLLGVQDASAKYCVAHNGVLNSNSWDAAGDEMTERTDFADVYEITFTNVPAQQVQFKVTIGDWSTSYNSFDQNISGVTLSTEGDNVAFTLAEAGDVVIRFDARDGGSTISVNPTSDPVLPTIKIAGDFTDPEWGDGAITLIDQDETTAVGTYNITTSDVEFKVIKNGNWLSNASEFTRGGDAQEVTANNDDNMWFTADVPGTYTFTWTYETNTLLITYPASYTLAVTDADWASLCLPFDATVPEGADAYRAESLYLSEGVEYIISLKSIDAIPAGEGVLVNASEGSYAFYWTDETPAAISNLLIGTTAEWTVEGTIYTLAYAWQGFPIFSQYTPETLAANKAYLPASALGGSAAQVRFVIDNDQVTSLKKAEEGTEIKKALINGQIMILRGEKMFDVNGRQVK